MVSMWHFRAGGYCLLLINKRFNNVFVLAPVVLGSMVLVRCGERQGGSLVTAQRCGWQL